MALLNKLKSLLGLDDGGSDGDRQGTDTVGVTVEHEPDESEPSTDEEPPPATPAPGNEAAAPEPAEEDETETSEPSAETDPDVEPEVDSPPAEDTVDESPEELDGRGSTAESEPESESGPAVDAETTETEPEPTTDADSEPGTDEEPVRDIKGVGPSYATKLSEAGVDSTADLAAADATELSEATGLSEKRIQGWIDRAQER